MAHYAMVDRQTNIVTVVFVGRDEDDLDPGMTSWEDHYSNDQEMCLRTSYNTQRNKHTNGGTPFRGNYAQPGYSYLPDYDAFLDPKPGDDFQFDPETMSWEPITPEVVVLGDD